MSYDPITREEFQEALPSKVRKNVNQDVIDIINSGIKDPELLAVYRENVIGLASVMSEGKFKLFDYLNAVRYVSHKLLGDTNVQAWAKTYPNRYNEMVKAGKDRGEIASVASRYNSSKLVTSMMAQTLVPTHILNAPLHQKAINHLAHLMVNARSEKVQSDSAAKLIDALKPPEVAKIELDVKHSDDDSIKELRESTRALIETQREMIQKGHVTPRSIAESTVVGQGETKAGKVVNLD